jgi:hypothetical protein
MLTQQTAVPGEESVPASKASDSGALVGAQFQARYIYYILYTCDICTQIFRNQQEFETYEARPKPKSRVN